MQIYLLNIGLIIIYRVIFSPDTLRRNGKIFCILASLNWILLSGLRHLTIGADTIKYGYFFEQAKSISWSTLLKDAVNIFFHGALGKDPGYIVFQKLFQLICTNYRVYLIFIAVIFTIPLGIWIYKNSADPFISFLIYSCMFYSFFAITGIRQTIATVMVVVVGYRYIKERRLWIFLLIILVAAGIHYSAICFFPFYFMADNEISDRFLLLSGGTFAGIIIFKEGIFRLGSRLIGYDQYLPYEEAGTTKVFTLFLIFLALVTLIKRKEILTNNPQAKHYINALIIAVLLVPLTYINPSAMRVLQYFSFFIMLLVPEIINSFKRKEKIFVFLIVSVTLILLLIKNNPDYMFYWQL